MSERLQGGSTTFWKCVADALFLATLNLGNSNVQFKDIAEVDAAGRYIPFPLVCRWLTMPSRTPLGAYYIYQRRGCHSVCSSVQVFLGPKVASRQKPDTPLFFCSHQSYNLTSPILGVWRTII